MSSPHTQNCYNERVIFYATNGHSVHRLRVIRHPPSWSCQNRNNGGAFHPTTATLLIINCREERSLITNNNNGLLYKLNHSKWSKQILVRISHILQSSLFVTPCKQCTHAILIVLVHKLKQFIIFKSINITKAINITKILHDSVLIILEHRHF